MIEANEEPYSADFLSGILRSPTVANKALNNISQPPSRLRGKSLISPILKVRSVCGAFWLSRTE